MNFGILLLQMKKPLLVYDCDNGINNLASANKMKSLTSKSGIPQFEVADRIGISESYFSDLLNAKRNWSEALALKLTRALNGKKAST